MYKVYLIKNLSENHYKIGYTRRKVEDRLNEFKTGNSSDLAVITFFESEWGSKIEAALHKRFSTKKVDREWFNLTREDVENFFSDCQKIHDSLNHLNSKNTWVESRGFL
jgi:hypothetical protein